MSESIQSDGAVPNSARSSMTNAVRQGASDGEATMSATLLPRREAARLEVARTGSDASDVLDAAP